MIEALDRIGRRRSYLEHRARDQLVEARGVAKDKQFPGRRKRVMNALAAHKRTLSLAESLYEQEIIISGFIESLQNIKILDQSQRSLAKCHTLCAVESIMDSVHTTLADASDIVDAASCSVSGENFDISDEDLEAFLEKESDAQEYNSDFFAALPDVPQDQPRKNELKRRNVKVSTC